MKLMPAFAALSSISSDRRSSVLPTERRGAEAQTGDAHASAAKLRELHIAQALFGLDSRQAAVDRKIDTGDVAALVRGEE